MAGNFSGSSFLDPGVRKLTRYLVILRDIEPGTNEAIGFESREDLGSFLQHSDPGQVLAVFDAFETRTRNGEAPEA